MSEKTDVSTIIKKKRPIIVLNYVLLKWDFKFIVIKIHFKHSSKNNKVWFHALFAITSSYSCDSGLVKV
ncbi:hypothetical protein ING2E5B_0423 [Fermentimonas caenicola]|jgi:hypothetical protein|uniref:Uncharacterized protein n=1 Tax=Fermentimonas caenicola TaxID=1562970 RepID=A0A098BYE0_9BACT|nr:hypothetical protein ING2E5B_0423 [Fermentimonas caenicola]